MLYSNNVRNRFNFVSDKYSHLVAVFDMYAEVFFPQSDSLSDWLFIQ